MEYRFAEGSPGNSRASPANSSMRKWMSSWQSVTSRSWPPRTLRAPFRSSWSPAMRSPPASSRAWLRPGGNLTGVTCITSELMPKRMAVFRELLPSASRLVVLYNPENVSKPPEAARTVALAKELGLDAKAVQFRMAKTSSAPFPRECSNIAPVSTLFLLERYRAQLNAPKSCARQVRCAKPYEAQAVHNHIRRLLAARKATRPD